MNPNETYVSLDTAKLLKEADFDQYVDQYYGSKPYIDGVLATGYRGDLRKAGAEWRLDKKLTNCWYKNRQEELGYAAPTLAVAQKWLREVKGWEAQVAYGFDEDGHKTYVTECGNPKGDLENYIVYFSTYEEALEACIKKALEIILEKEEKS